MLAHTGQNYETTLSDVFFEGLGVPAPDEYLGISGGDFAARIGDIFGAVKGLLDHCQPDRLLVLGDTDSALCAYVAKRKGVPVYHMEAGNRCFDDRVSEEVNRRLIDHSSDVLMPYTNRSRDNLLREGINPASVFVVGNPIKEVLDKHMAQIEGSDVLQRVGRIRPLSPPYGAPPRNCRRRASSSLTRRGGGGGCWGPRSASHIQRASTDEGPA